MCHVNSSKPVLPIDVCKSAFPIDVCKSARPVNSKKPIYPFNVCQSGGSVDVLNPVCLVDICKPFFVDYWKYVALFLILLFFAVSINTIVFKRTILYMVLFINIHMTYLIFSKFLKCTLLF